MNDTAHLQPFSTRYMRHVWRGFGPMNGLLDEIFRCEWFQVARQHENRSHWLISVRSGKESVQ